METEIFKTRVSGGPEKLFTPSQREALRNYNRYCDAVRGDFKRGANGLAQIREIALQLFISGGHSIHHLVGALFALRPHWTNGGKGEATVKAIFHRLHNTEDVMEDIGDAFVTMSTNRFLRELELRPPEPPAIVEVSDFEARQIAHGKFCVIHPERPWHNKRLRICSTCYQKLWKLDLLDHPFDAAIIELLKKRLKRGQGMKFVPKNCVNHEHRIALPNGLCVRCNENIGINETTA